MADLILICLIVGAIGTALFMFTFFFIMGTIRGFFFHRLELFFKRSKGWGEVIIFGDDRQIEIIAANLKQKEVIVNRGDHSERYTVNPRLVFQNAWDRIPTAMWKKNNPNQLNPMKEPRVETKEFSLNCPKCKVDLKHTAEFKFVDLDDEPKEAADVIDSLILRHKLLGIGDWFRKNWFIMLVAVILVGVAVGVVWWLLSGQLDDIAAQNTKIISLVAKNLTQTATQVKVA